MEIKGSNLSTIHSAYELANSQTKQLFDVINGKNITTIHSAHSASELANVKKSYDEMVKTTKYERLMDWIKQYSEKPLVIEEAEKQARQVIDWANKYNELYPESISNILEKRLEKLPSKDVLQFRPYQLPGIFGILDIIKSIDETEITDFYNYLNKYRMLGLNHPIGKKIFDTIKEKADSHEEKDFYNANGISLFRGRIRSKKLNRPLTDDEIWNAPYGLSGQGRYNGPGQGYLYYSDNLDCSVSELSPSKKQIIDIAERRLNCNANILNLFDIECPLISYSSFSVGTDKMTIDPAYLIPNFLGECCKIAGIDGLRYKSTKMPESSCYVFFDYQQKWFESISVKSIEYKKGKTV